MFCTACGNQIDDNSKFCPFCGCSIMPNDSSNNMNNSGYNSSEASQQVTMDYTNYNNLNFGELDNNINYDNNYNNTNYNNVNYNNANYNYNNANYYSQPQMMNNAYNYGNNQNMPPIETKRTSKGAMIAIGIIFGIIMILSILAGILAPLILEYELLNG